MLRKETNKEDKKGQISLDKAPGHSIMELFQDDNDSKRGRMEDIVSKYKGSGFKLTPQRIEILKFLDGNTSHPTAEDIYREVKKRCATVSFATVYNTLEALKKRGELLEVTIDPERKHFDPNPAPHHHIVCASCGRIEDVFEDYSETLRLPDEVLQRFTMTGNHIDFFGFCAECEKLKT